ncbi:MAG TPA: hypothetical protein VK666_00610 [Chryseolinea sp.]|nr:hypothetical protein [Chryseolinea sp.]
MRQTSLLLLVITLLPFSCDTEQNVPPVFETYFTKYYGEDGNQVGVDLLVNNDGSMILLGNSSSQTNPVTIPFIVKIDPEGLVLWQRELGELNEEAVDVEVDGNNNLIIVSNVGTEDNSRIRIFRLNQDGRGLDSVLINSSVKQVARSVTPVSDGSFLISGYAGPTFVADNELTNDQADLLIYRVDENLDPDSLEPLVKQGGEHVGKIVKVFQSKQAGPIKYLACGDSDRPFDEGENYRESFEVILRNKFGDPDGLRAGGTGDESQYQRASTAIETPGFMQERYLMVGSSFTQNNSSNIFIAQYSIEDENLSVRFSTSIPLGGRMEGISAAPIAPDGYLILANEFRDNAKRDIILVKVADDGNLIGSTSFGSVEGDDSAGAVRVLADGRVAVFGTIELETQRKMVLIVLSPDGKFSNG